MLMEFNLIPMEFHGVELGSSPIGNLQDISIFDRVSCRCALLNQPIDNFCQDRVSKPTIFRCEYVCLGDEHV